MESDGNASGWNTLDVIDETGKNINLSARSNFFPEE